MLKELALRQLGLKVCFPFARIKQGFSSVGAPLWSLAFCRRGIAHFLGPPVFARSRHPAFWCGSSRRDFRNITPEVYLLKTPQCGCRTGEEECMAAQSGFRLNINAPLPIFWRGVRLFRSYIVN
jgi:hypothetical protein